MLFGWVFFKSLLIFHLYYTTSGKVKEGKLVCTSFYYFKTRAITSIINFIYKILFIRRESTSKKLGSSLSSIESMHFLVTNNSKIKGYSLVL